MKALVILLEEVLADRDWCPKCERFVTSDQVRYGCYGNPRYHAISGCGEDVRRSDLLDVHRRMLEQALEIGRAACEPR